MFISLSSNVLIEWFCIRSNAVVVDEDGVRDVIANDRRLFIEICEFAGQLSSPQTLDAIIPWVLLPVLIHDGEVLEKNDWIDLVVSSPFVSKLLTDRPIPRKGWSFKIGINLDFAIANKEALFSTVRFRSDGNVNRIERDWRLFRFCYAKYLQDLTTTELCEDRLFETF